MTETESVIFSFLVEKLDGYSRWTYAIWPNHVKRFVFFIFLYVYVDVNLL